MFTRSTILASSLVAAGSLVSANNPGRGYGHGGHGGHGQPGPCDIYASGDTPCVAAHSTTRALYRDYNGPLYQVSRDSDDTTTDVMPLNTGGVANAAAQDHFCAGTTCLISIIYDQSERNNHLTRAPPGGAAAGPQPGGFDNLASATGAPVYVDGHKAYGVFISPGTGYRNDQTSGVAINDEPEGMYAVLDGTHYNDGCCFDYGNAETNNLDTGNGHMEAIYFGDNSFWGSGSGPGPWIMADLENGLFSGEDISVNLNDPTITFRFLTSVVKGEPNHWAIRGGNANGNKLSTFYDGVRPNATGYNPMSKEGAILLGIGGDNSISGQGTWYEGVMTQGYPSDKTENKVQTNIQQARYAAAPLQSGPRIRVGSTIHIQATTPGYTDRYLAHSGATVVTEVVSASSDAATKAQASWIVHPGLGNAACLSFESADTPGSYIRHFAFQLQLNADDGSKQMHEDATFCAQEALDGNRRANSIRAAFYPTRYIRHYNNLGYIATNGGPEAFDSRTSYNDDVSFIVSNHFA